MTIQAFQLPETAGRPPHGGFISGVRGLVAEAHGLDLPVGAMAEVETSAGFSEAEVVGFRDGKLQLVPLTGMRGVGPGCAVWRTRKSPSSARASTCIRAFMAVRPTIPSTCS